MANWISSKLKAAESILQQIDQQAAESLRKNERYGSQSDAASLDSGGDAGAASGRGAAAPPLRYQLPRKSSSPPLPTVPSTSSTIPRSTYSHLPPADDVSGTADDFNWTELLGGASSKPRELSPASRRRSKAATRIFTGSLAKKDVKMRGSELSESNIHSEIPVSSAKATETPEQEKVIISESSDRRDGVASVHRKEQTRNDSISQEEHESETESGSSSTSESEEELQRREERRKKREEMILAKMAAAAVQAIKERDEIVVMLEDEKKILTDIVKEREKQQVLEALELQTAMMETMEAAEHEKQKHRSTRMEALARLAELETRNTELSKSLATSQWHLEEQVKHSTQLWQQVELKERAQKERMHKISIMHQRSLKEVESSRKAEVEKEILDAEYAFTCDKIAKCKDKLRKLEEHIERTRKEMAHPTDVEVEIKRRLMQLTDHLIKKQAQVEALSSEKATLLFRIETVSRQLSENGLPTQASISTKDSDLALAGSTTKADLEAGSFVPPKSAFKHPFHAEFRSGTRQLFSLLRQLDALFSLGAVLLLRNRKAQIWSLIYLVCLHVWVMYIMMSHSTVPDGASHGVVYSLETINKTSI